MFKRKFLLFFVVLCWIGYKLTAQNQNVGDKVYWENDVKLVWEDFQGTPDYNYFASALSLVGMEFKLSQEGESILVTSPVSFNIYGSWVKPKDKSSYLLNHEQVHFDIFELNARKYRKRISRMKRFGPPKFWTNRMKRIFIRYQKRAVRMQKRYDRQTKHSIKKRKQARWDKKIEQELKELEPYSDEEMSFPLR